SGQEHGAADDAVCAEQSVDGAQADLEAAGMSAPAPRAMPCGAGKTGAEGRNPPSKTIRIRLRCRHPKSIDSAHAAAGVVQMAWTSPPTPPLKA
ncbi:MAG: hypothetical protein WBL16_03530, partial [Zwartia sp.]